MACWNVGRFCQGSSGWLMPPVARNWIVSKHSGVRVCPQAPSR